MTVDELIERLEKAEGPSRELDEAIAKAVLPVSKYYAAGVRIPAYTSSIDEALTLVPKGMPWMVRRSQPWDAHHPYCAAYVQRAENHECAATAAAPAISICIAALRARSAGKG